MLKQLVNTLLDILGEDTKHVAVSHVENNAFCSEKTGEEELPPFTRVEILSKPCPESNIHIEVWLPDREYWNGSFVGTGNGGIAGSIRYDNLSRYLSQGYACANTDLGTSGGKLCGYKNSAVWADFGWRATHIMTEDAKKIIRIFYEEPEKFSYFVGRSTGGQQAFSEAQRFPADYDGICAGVPGFYRTALHAYFCWNYCKLHDPDGTPVFSEKEIQEITALAPSYFAEKGGAECGDAFVSYPWHGKDTVIEFVEWLQNRCEWMTVKKKNVLLAVYSGPSDPKTGEKIYCGMPIGAETESGGMITFSGDHCKNFYPFYWAFGPEMKENDFKFGNDFRDYQNLLSDDMDAIDPDLSAFAARGGKLIGYSGSTDPWVPFPASFSFYERAAEYAGGTERLLDFFRYYLIPGRAHSGGPGAEVLYLDESRHGNAFHALVRWVEDGIPPEKLLAAGKENGFAREVYPYGSKEFPFCEHA